MVLADPFSSVRMVLILPKHGLMLNSFLLLIASLEATQQELVELLIMLALAFPNPLSWLLVVGLLRPEKYTSKITLLSMSFFNLLPSIIILLPQLLTHLLNRKDGQTGN